VLAVEPHERSELVQFALESFVFLVEHCDAVFTCEGVPVYEDAPVLAPVDDCEQQPPRDCWVLLSPHEPVADQDSLPLSLS
jgi:hypothetical protein